MADQPAPSPADIRAENKRIILNFKADFQTYATACLSVRDKDGSVIPFKLNKAQQFVHQKLQDQLEATGRVRALILKGRQQGISTYTQARYYWKTSLSVGKQAFILTHSQDATDAIFGITKRYHDNCPALIKPATRTASAKELAFSDIDSGYIVATAGSKAAGRGRTIQYLHSSEVAFWDNAPMHLAGLGQALSDSNGTEHIMESTANGVGNTFYQLWQDAERNLGDFIAIFVPWTWQREYARKVPADFLMTQAESDYADIYGLTPEQTYWKRLKIINDFQGDITLFSQEFPQTPNEAFRKTDGNSLIDAEHVARARKLTDVEARGPIIIGVDPAEYGKDASSIVVRQGRKVTYVKSYHGRGLMELVGLISILADQIGPDAINVDCTGIGAGVADRLKELNYPVNRINFGGKALNQERYAMRKDEMWSEMKEWFEDTPCQVPDMDTLESDVCAPSYTYDSSRRLKIESKEQMKKRGVSSPNEGDALALTFAVRIAPMGNMSLRNSNRTTKGSRLRESRTSDWRAM